MNWKCLLGWHEWLFITASFLGERYVSPHGYINITSAFVRCKKCQYGKFIVVPGNWRGKMERETDEEIATLRKMSGLE